MDAALLELSRLFVSESDLLDVAFRGLEIQDNTVKKHINDNAKDINLAAYKCFREWLNKQPNTDTAQENIKTALDKADKTLFKQNFNALLHKNNPLIISHVDQLP